MDASITLKNKINIIGAASNFCYHWCLNSGLNESEAAEISTCISELVTDVILFAFRHKEGEMHITFNRHPDQVEIILHELGEPFNPDRHLYRAGNARETGDFEGAGFAVMKALSDEFIYINKGKQGKEFHLIKKLTVPHISRYPGVELVHKSIQPDKTAAYWYQLMATTDAEDISKLIYRTYGHSYIKDTLYYPRKISLDLQQKEKFGVITRTQEGEAVGCFSILKSTDSNIGEVGEAVVSPNHRRRGLMTEMLNILIREARNKQLLALFGEANAAHQISQKVNAKFNFQTASLVIGLGSAMKMEGFGKKISSQRLSAFFEFLPLQTRKVQTFYFPPEYNKLFHDIYKILGVEIKAGRVKKMDPPKLSNIELQLDTDHHVALFVVLEYGQDFESILKNMITDLLSQGINTLYIDLPLDHPASKNIVPLLRSMDFFIAGVMPLFHNEKDYFRMQRLNYEYDIKLLTPYSAMAKRLFHRISKEYHEIRNER